MQLGDGNMKNFDSRTYSINDFIEWEERKQLEISPKFQRRSVWSPQAKSYLIDTILKDKPLPKIFIRATTDKTNSARNCGRTTENAYDFIICKRWI